MPRRAEARPRRAPGRGVPGRSLAVLAVLTLATAGPAVARQLPTPTVDVSVGAALGSRPGRHDSDLGVSADAFLGFRPGARERRAGGLLLGVGGSVLALPTEVSCDVVPGFPCNPGFPSFWTLSSLAGWESAAGGTRILAGPALARSQSESAAALQARVDVARPVSRRLWLLASGRLSYIPRHRGESFTLGAVGLGVRLQ